MTTPSDITKLLQEALDLYQAIAGQPTDNDIVATEEVLIDCLYTIPYNRESGLHHLVGFIQPEVKYKLGHAGTAFPVPTRLALWGANISLTATAVEYKKADASHKAKLKDYKNWKAADNGCRKFIHDVVEEVWIKELKDPDTYFHSVPSRNLLDHLKQTA